MAQAQNNDASADGVYISTTSDDWSEPFAESPSTPPVDADTAAYPPNADFAQEERSTASNRPQSSAFDLKDFIQGIAGRILLALVGIVLILIGIPMLILPGPGLLSIAAGAVCLCKAVGFTPKHKVRA